MRKFLKPLLLLMLCAAITGCAGVGSETPEGAYLGVASGKFSNVYYRADGNDLFIAFENTSTFTMKNLIIVVEQRTASGSAATQTGVPTLRMRGVKHLNFKIPQYSTGEVTVMAYFLISQQAISMGMGQNSDEITDVYPETAEDSISFRIIH